MGYVGERLFLERYEFTAEYDVFCMRHLGIEVAEELEEVGGLG